MNKYILQRKKKPQKLLIIQIVVTEAYLCGGQVEVVWNLIDITMFITTKVQYYIQCPPVHNKASDSLHVIFNLIWWFTAPFTPHGVSRLMQHEIKLRHILYIPCKYNLIKWEAIPDSTVLKQQPYYTENPYMFITKPEVTG